MRKGPIERYSVDATLRMAASEGCSGSIELTAPVGGTIYLEKGYVHFASLEGAPPPPDVLHAERPPKEAVRRYVESVLCVLFELDAGWYEWDPLGTHPDGVRWVFGFEGLERSVRARLDEDRSLRRWSVRPVTFEDTPDDIVRVSADMWRVALAMAAPASTHQLRDNLGWDAERLASTLEGLERLGLIADPTRPVRPTFPPATERFPAPEPASEAWGGTPDLTPRQLVHASPRLVAGLQAATTVDGGRAAAPAPAPGAPRHADPRPGPTADAPAPAPPDGASGGANRKSALKRLISSLRQ